VGVQWFCRAPRLVLAATIGFCVLSGVGVNKIWFDHNLLNMQPEGLESVAWEHKLLEQSDQSMWYALSIADTREELLAKKDEFQKLGAVARVEEIVSMLPTEHEVKQPIIERIHAKLSALPERPPLIAVDQPEELGRVLGRLQMMLSMSGQFPKAASQFEQARDALRRLPVSECYTRLSAFQQQMAGDLLSRLHVLGGMANPESPKLTDLPPSLVNRFVGQHGKHLLKIYGRGNIWDMEALKRFVHDVRTVDPAATGNPVQAYEASLEMKRSYEHSAYYALVVISVVLLVDFRSITTSLLATMPLALGMLLGFGSLGLLNIPLNPANMLALPLILGVGIDYGVHVVHDYLEQKGPYRMPPSIATAVTIDALTTIVGFGSLMIASHRGLQSLGRVLVICVTCTLICSLTVLPALLTWLTRNRREVADEAEEAEAVPAPVTPAPQTQLAVPAGVHRRFDLPHAAPAGAHFRPAARPSTTPSTPGVREL
jgi:predicted RND superfamily exporter protein